MGRVYLVAEKICRVEGLPPDREKVFERIVWMGTVVGLDVNNTISAMNMQRPKARSLYSYSGGDCQSAPTSHNRNVGMRVIEIPRAADTDVKITRKAG